MGNQPKISKSQLILIHIARRDLALDEDTYRLTLKNQTGKESAKNLTYAEAHKVVKYFEQCGWKPKSPLDPPFVKGGKGGFNSERRREGFASPRRIGMIKGLWADLSFAPKKRQKAALREFLWKRFHCSDLQFLTNEGAAKVINALLAMSLQGKRSEFGVQGSAKGEVYEGN